jgi:hypothetical protein
MTTDNGFREDSKPFYRFYLNRIQDETGVSRTGRVLEGVLTQSGKVITEWRPPMSTIGIYNTLQEFLTIHVDCHPSCNEVVWLDYDYLYQVRLQYKGKSITIQKAGIDGAAHLIAPTAQSLVRANAQELGIPAPVKFPLEGLTVTVIPPDSPEFVGTL